MRNIKDLSDEEKQSFLIEITEIHCDATDKVIRVADKYGISRDEVMKHFVTVFQIVSVFESFEDYELSEEV